jgi:hypothetical protein
MARLLAGVVCLAIFGTRAAEEEVRILAPRDGMVFPAYATFQIEVQPLIPKSEFEGAIYAKWDNKYFPGENIIAAVYEPPYALTLRNVPAGVHRYSVRLGSANPFPEPPGPWAYVTIVVTNPPLHTGPFTVAPVFGPGSEVTGINNAGVVVGNKDGYAMVWEKGRARRVPMPNENKGTARGINDAGTITGKFVREDGSEAAYFHTNGVTREIEIAGAVKAEGLRISPGGEISGVWMNAQNQWSGFVYYPDGRVTLGGTGRMQFNMTEHRAGYSTAGGGALLLGPVPDKYLEYQMGPLLIPAGADAINDAVEVAGWGRKVNDGRTTHHDAFLYTHYNLINMTEVFGLSHEAYSEGLNRWGQAVGHLRHTIHGPRGGLIGYGPTVPFLHSERQSWDLNELVELEEGVTLEKAMGMNDDGQIVVNGKVGAGENAVVEGFLLMPRPQVVSMMWRGDEVVLQVLDRPGTRLVVESSRDFENWTTKGTQTTSERVTEVTLTKSNEPEFFRIVGESLTASAER